MLGFLLNLFNTKINYTSFKIKLKKKNMKRKILNILTVAFIITTIGFIMDGDAKEPSMLIRFMEFVLMLGIVFILTSIVYSIFNFARRSFLKA